MKKLLIISNCSECTNHYMNYMPAGVEGKHWCKQLDKKLERVDLYKRMPRECPLMDTDLLDIHPCDNCGGVTFP
jgi:hypothetical protein